MGYQGQILVYSIVGCPHCMKAKNTLADEGLPYTDISVDKYPAGVRMDVKKRTGKSTVPQIFFNEHYIGGNEDLQNLIKLDKCRFGALVEEVKTKSVPEGALKPPDPTQQLVEKDESSDFICEPDEYAVLVKDLKKSGLIKDHKSGLLTVHKQSFSGKEFVEWIVKARQTTPEQAVEIGQSLINNHFGHHVKMETIFKNDNTYYRLIEDDVSSALNSGSSSTCKARPAGELGEDLRKLILKLYNDYLSKDGRAVDYAGIGKSEDFVRYVELTKELQRVNILEASREEKLAFFINIYNALVIHANVRRGPPVNLWQRYKFFNTMRYIIGGQQYSLQDIENGVLRSNRKGVGMFTRPFGKGDPRVKVALDTHEPLIHFALVCGAKSCPPIKTYSSEGIYDQLNLATEAFLDGEDAISLNMSKKEVKLSMIMKWYKADFGKNDEEVVQWLYDHMTDSDKKNELKELMDGKKPKLSYLHYDWGVNSQ